MSNWTGMARSNYFAVKDMDGLAATLAPFDIEIEQDTGEHAGKVCLLANTDGGGWPSFVHDDDDNEIEFDPAVHICPYLADDEILVLMEAGFERQRYCSGYASAFNARGERVELSLRDIYTKAAQTFGVDEGIISQCQY